MKRINPDTGKIFKMGDIREEDSRIFITYSLTRIVKKTGYFAETWAWKRPKANKNTKEYRFKYSRKRVIRRRYWLSKYKVNKGCELCGYNTHAVALDFDHKDRFTKTSDISHLVGGNLKNLINEIRKCRVLCAICHRLETNKEGVYSLRL